MLGEQASTILMYHGIGEPSPMPEDEGDYDVRPADFERQLDALSAHEVIGLDDLIAGRKNGVVITFDDGERSVLTQAAPALAQRGMSAVAYISTARLGKPNYLDVHDVAELAQMGVTIGSHGHTHRMLSSLPRHELFDELERSRGVLSDALGLEVVHMSLPGGRGGARVVEAARAVGYRSVATSVPGQNSCPADAFALTRMPVKDGVSPRHLRSLCFGDLRTYAPVIARERALRAAKWLLGDDKYRKVRRGIRSALRKTGG